MTLHAQMVMSHSQRYPWKLFLIKFELDINVIFLCGFSEKLTCAFLVYEKQYTHRKNTLSEKRRIFRIFDRMNDLRVPFQIGHCHLYIKAGGSLEFTLPVSSIQGIYVFCLIGTCSKYVDLYVLEDRRRLISGWWE